VCAPACLAYSGYLRVRLEVAERFDTRDVLRLELTCASNDQSTVQELMLVHHWVRLLLLFPYCDLTHTAVCRFLTRLVRCMHQQYIASKSCYSALWQQLVKWHLASYVLTGACVMVRHHTTADTVSEATARKCYSFCRRMTLIVLFIAEYKLCVMTGTSYAVLYH
jgi:hypothetical protein